MAFLKLCKIHFAGFVKMGENSQKYCSARDKAMWKSLWKMWITLCSEKLLINLCEYRQKGRRRQKSIKKLRFAQNKILFSGNPTVHFYEKSNQRAKEMKDLIRDYILYYTASLYSEIKAGATIDGIWVICYNYNAIVWAENRCTVALYCLLVQLSRQSS